MSETMVERVAKIVRDGNEGGWDYPAIAFLAIEAMREPTRAEELAGLRAMIIDPTSFKPAWQAAIDAALATLPGEK